MPYIDGKLASGERVLRREHQHWFVLVADARYGILAIVAAILLLILRGAARTTGQFDAHHRAGSSSPSCSAGLPTSAGRSCAG